MRETSRRMQCIRCVDRTLAAARAVRSLRSWRALTRTKKQRRGRRADALAIAEVSEPRPKCAPWLRIDGESPGGLGRSLKVAGGGGNPFLSLACQLPELSQIELKACNRVSSSSKNGCKV